MTFVEIQNALIDGRAHEVSVPELQNAIQRYTRLGNNGGIHFRAYLRLAELAQAEMVARFN